MKKMIICILLSLASMGAHASLNYEINQEDLNMIHNQSHAALSSYYLCKKIEDTVTFVRIDKAILVSDQKLVQAFGQVSYKCDANLELVTDEYCEFHKDLKNNTWLVHYCDH